MRRLTVVSATAATAALLLTGMTAPAVAADGGVVINEFSVNTDGTMDDFEYLELLAAPGTDLSAYRVLEIEGDGAGSGLVDEVVAFPAPDASGRSLVNLAPNALENGSVSLLLVTGTIPALGTDIDADDDGVIDDGRRLTLVDAVAVNDGGAGDLTYGGVTLGVSYDGQPFAPGGASRIPGRHRHRHHRDWVRNDFDLAGIPNFTGTLIEGEALEHAWNRQHTVGRSRPAPGDADCDRRRRDDRLGPGFRRDVAGRRHDRAHRGRRRRRLPGRGGFNGYYLQDAGDGDAATSDGIFVYAPNGAAGSRRRHRERRRRRERIRLGGDRSPRSRLPTSRSAPPEPRCPAPRRSTLPAMPPAARRSRACM